MAARVTVIAWGLDAAREGGALRHAFFARARALEHDYPDAEGALIDRAGIDAGAGVAALTVAVELPDRAGGPCLRADPVHLRADLREVHLFSPLGLDIDGDEAAALLDALNAHFRSDGIEFAMGEAPYRWYVFADDVDLTAPSSMRVPVAAMRELTVGGADAGLWRRRASEIEMLLHAHPVNEARSAVGRPTVNGVWFWGGPEIRTRSAPSARVRSCRGADPLLRAAAAVAGAEHRPGSGDGFDPAGDEELVVDERLQSAWHDPAADQAAVARDFASGLLDPLCRAVGRGRLRALEVIGETRVWRLGTADWWRLWRRE